VLLRMTRSSMLEMLGRIMCARPRPRAGQRLVMGRHVFKNALPPILTIVGILFGSLLSGAVLTETIFNWPGIGRYATTSVTTLDYPAVMGVALVAAVIYPLVNTLVDIGYSVIDPRVRTTETMQATATAAPITARRVMSPNALILRRFRRRRPQIFGLLVIVLFALLAVFAPVLAPYDPLRRISPTAWRRHPRNTGWAPTSWGATFSAACSTARASRWARAGCGDHGRPAGDAGRHRGRLCRRLARRRR
jgi:ABC-type dipeptide/oligopeptide/nickel transport system permease subunit